MTAIIEKYNVSRHLHFQPMEEGMWVGWNRYFPSMFIGNDVAMSILESIRNRTPLPGGDDAVDDDELAAFVEELKKNKFIHEGETDPSRDDYFRMVEACYAPVKENFKRLYQDKVPYKGFSISNDECNLKCPYCVNEHKKQFSHFKMDPEKRWEQIRTCLQQYVSRYHDYKSVDKNGKEEGISVFFNGGEILLEWKLLKRVVEWLTETYPRHTFDFALNTNMTLVTEEIAAFLLKHNFEVFISIDGYKELHNRTRIYRRDRGSFDDVIKNVQLFRKLAAPKPRRHFIRRVTKVCKPFPLKSLGFGANKNTPRSITKVIVRGQQVPAVLDFGFKPLRRLRPLSSFQGTIDEMDNFEPQKIYEMTKYDMKSARLAPNLLGVTPEEAVQKAHMMKTFLELNKKNDFQVTEMFFTNAKRIINQDTFTFSFNCQGLSCSSGVGFHLNVSTMRMSQLCSFVSEASLPLEELGNDIYNPRLGDHSMGFIRRRMDALKTVCDDCPLIGTCAGGCIYSGLDKENKINEAGCTYQKEMWKIYLEDAYRADRDDEAENPS